MNDDIAATCIRSMSHESLLSVNLHWLLVACLVIPVLFSAFHSYVSIDRTLIGPV